MLNSPDPFLTLFAGAVLVFGVKILWPATGTPVLLLPFVLQWLSVALKPIQSALTGHPLNDFAERGADLPPAAWFGLAGLAALGLGMRLGSTVPGRNFARELREDAARWPQRSVVTASLLAILAGHVLEVASGMAGPARQPVLMMSSIKLAGLFVLTYWCLSRRRALGLLALVLGFEIVYGMTGYFSDFKSTLLVGALAALAARPRLDFAATVVGTVAFAGVLFVVVFWSAVKPDYRLFMTGGAHTYATQRTIGERVDYLADRLAAMDRRAFGEGFGAFAARLSYIDFLALTMAYTPSVMPHAAGAQTGEAVRHILMPRLLFPDKAPAPHDTYVTATYTGLSFTAIGFTSISIGYLGELYIDFGIAGALVAMGMLGLVIGLGYRCIMSYRRLPTSANAALATMAVVPFVFFERALLKLVGGSLTLFIACLVIQRVVMPRALAMIGARRAGRRRGATHRPPASPGRAVSGPRRPAPRPLYRQPRGSG